MPGQRRAPALCRWVLMVPTGLIWGLPGEGWCEQSSGPAWPLTQLPQD